MELQPDEWGLRPAGLRNLETVWCSGSCYGMLSWSRYECVRSKASVSRTGSVAIGFTCLELGEHLVGEDGDAGKPGADITSISFDKVNDQCSNVHILFPCTDIQPWYYV